MNISCWFPCGADGQARGWGGWVGGWLYGHMTTKISWMARQPNLLSYGAPFACALRMCGALLLNCQPWNDCAWSQSLTERFPLYSFAWESFGVLDRWLVTQRSSTVFSLPSPSIALSSPAILTPPTPQKSVGWYALLHGKSFCFSIVFQIVGP